MTFLKGTTTWNELASDLVKLVCGEIPDSTASLVSGTDKWLRDDARTITDGALNSTNVANSATANFVATDVGKLWISAGVPTGTTITVINSATQVQLSAPATATATNVTTIIGTDTIRTQAGGDVPTGACSNRTGYFAYLDANGGGLASVGGVAGNFPLKVVAPYTSDPTTSGSHRWIVILQVNNANVVSGNYSTASLSYFISDADTGVLLTATSINPNAAGLITLPNGLQISIANPSGFAPISVRWVRAFSATYMYGVDWWPMLSRQGATTPSFSVAPPGVAGTDYAIEYGAHTSIASGMNVTAIRGDLFHGLGIKTATGLGSNSLYTVSFSMALAKCRWFKAPGANGQLSLDAGGSRPDQFGAMQAASLRVSQWARCFQTPASVTGASQVQYWISVRQDGIFIVLNGDPGTTGKLGTSWIGTFTPYEPTNDAFPVIFTTAPISYLIDNSAIQSYSYQYGYWGMRHRLDGSDASRDWQTRWMRSDFGGSFVSSGANRADVVFAANAVYTSETQNTSTDFPARQSKPAPDGKWWLYGDQYSEGNTISDFNSANAPSGPEDVRFQRGYQAVRFFFVPDSGWISGDELTDTATSTKYLLVAPDYAGAGVRFRTGTNQYFGGVAVAEV